ncbi:MAG: hypothetical protein ACI4QX_01675 [Lachnospiraceae bacterium]
MDEFEVPPGHVIKILQELKTHIIKSFYLQNITTRLVFYKKQ